MSDLSTPPLSTETVNGMTVTVYPQLILIERGSNKKKYQMCSKTYAINRFRKEFPMRNKDPHIDDIYKADPVKACQLALRRTAKVPWKERMGEIDTLLKGYGIEGINGEWQNGYWCNVVAEYVNMGDTYATTVIHVRGDWSGGRSRFIVSSFGDWVEKNQKKYSIV